MAERLDFSFDPVGESTRKTRPRNVKGIKAVNETKFLIGRKRPKKPKKRKKPLIVQEIL